MLRRVIQLTVITIAIAFTGQAYAEEADWGVFYNMGVGAFGKKGHEFGRAGGGGYSGCTFSVAGLPGDAPLCVKPFNEHSGGLTVLSDGTVRVDGHLVVSGQKRFAVRHPEDPHREISYVSLEGPEAGTYIRGTAEMSGGRVAIELPEHFGLVTSEDALTVSVTPVGMWLELYVVEKSATRIVIEEAKGKTGRFDYLVQGIRKGHEGFQAISSVQN
jgi:hypothetical protein